MPDKDQNLEIAMGNMLRIGVTLAALVVLAGGILYLLHASGPIPDYRHFHAPASGDFHIASTLAGAIHLNSASLIEFGILLLIATPVCRVIFGVIGFATEKDWLYTAISAVVLAVLIFSFLSRK